MARSYIFPATGGQRPAGSFVKDPAERYPVGVNMQRMLPTGRTVSRATAVVTDLADDSVVTGTLLVTSTAAKTGNFIVDVTVRAGTDDHRYKVVYTIYDDVTGVYKEFVLFRVRAVPNG